MRAGIPYLAAALSTVAIGLAVHRGTAIPPAARDVCGDALWATMMTWWVGVVAPHARILLRAATALAMSWAVELGQLYHAPAIDSLRDTTLGRLTLGTDFDARDLAAYTAGVAVAVLLEIAVRRSRKPRRA